MYNLFFVLLGILISVYVIRPIFFSLRFPTKKITNDLSTRNIKYVSYEKIKKKEVKAYMALIEQGFFLNILFCRFGYYKVHVIKDNIEMNIFVEFVKTYTSIIKNKINYSECFPR